MEEPVAKKTPDDVLDQLEALAKRKTAKSTWLEVRRIESKDSLAPKAIAGIIVVVRKGSKPYAPAYFQVMVYHDGVVLAQANLPSGVALESSMIDTISMRRVGALLGVIAKWRPH